MTKEKKGRDDKGTSLRLIVLESLLLQEKEGQKLNILINGVLARYEYLSREDRAFIKILTEGTVERRITLDYVIDRFSRIKTGKMKPVIRNILRMSAYQMLFMEHIPVHSVCDEAVRLVKKKHMQPLSGFVNGVLRSMARESIDLDSIEDPSVRYSFPGWIYERFTEEFGKEKTIEIFRYCLDASPVYIRINRTKTKIEEMKKILECQGIETKDVPDHPYALEISGFSSIGTIEGFREGLFSVQDVSSMAIGDEIAGIIERNRPEGLKIIDVCASPGGKSCHAAEILMEYRNKNMCNGKFCVESRDISEGKTVFIEENRERLGLDIIRTFVMDARQPNVTGDKDEDSRADIIIADLPCSGLGVMGRKNDLKYRVKPGDIKSLQLLQRDILKATDTYLENGGYLLFSVCTITRDETIEQRNWIQNEFGYELLGEKLLLPGEKRTDGFFCSVFRKGRT